MPGAKAPADSPLPGGADGGGLLTATDPVMRGSMPALEAHQLGALGAGREGMTRQTSELLRLWFNSNYEARLVLLLLAVSPACLRCARCHARGHHWRS